MVLQCFVIGCRYLNILTCHVNTSLIKPQSPWNTSFFRKWQLLKMSLYLISDNLNAHLVTKSPAFYVTSYYLVHNSLPLHILSQFILSFHILTPYLWNDIFHLVFRLKFCMHYNVHNACYIHHPSNSPWFNYCNMPKIWWRVQIMTLRYAVLFMLGYDPSKLTGIKFLFWTLVHFTAALCFADRIERTKFIKYLFSSVVERNHNNGDKLNSCQALQQKTDCLTPDLRLPSNVYCGRTHHSRQHSLVFYHSRHRQNLIPISFEPHGRRIRPVNLQGLWLLQVCEECIYSPVTLS
jgi:hypothetical protein